MRQQTKQVLATEAMELRQASLTGDDTVSLVDLFIMLHRNRVWLLAGVLSGIVATMAWVFLPSPVYESQATIQIGAIREKGMLEEPAALTARLIDRYGAEAAHTGPRDTPFLVRAGQASFGKNTARSPHILKLVVVGSSPDDAKSFLAKIVETLVQDHGLVYEGYLTPLRERLMNVEQEIASMKTQTEQLSRAADRLMSSQPVQASLLALEKGRLITQLSQLEQDRFNLSRQIRDPFIASTRVLTPPTLPTRPSHLGIVLTGIVGVLVGLALGIFAAYLRELYSNVRKAQNDPLNSRSTDGDRF